MIGTDAIGGYCVVMTDDTPNPAATAASDLINRLRGRAPRITPHPGPVGPEQNVGSSKSGALRAAIFGMNDGLVSNLSLIFGVAGSGVAGKVVVIAGFAGLLAGSFSMAAGEYVSMKVQREVFEQLIHKEAHEIATEPEEEQRELARIYEKKGIDPETAHRISVALMKDPEVALGKSGTNVLQESKDNQNQIYYGEYHERSLDLHDCLAFCAERPDK